VDYSRPDRAERLAAEYALGTLRGGARRRFEALLPAHPALRAALADWHARLEPLTDALPAVQPPERVWAGVQTRLFDTPEAPTPWWQRLGVWRAFSGTAVALAVAMLALNLREMPAQPPVVVVLAGNPQVAQGLQARFVASVSADGRALVLRPLDALPGGPGRALELWAVPAEGAPRSLGLLTADGRASVQRNQLLQGTAALAVSIEPPGGSPTGAPTGPVVSVGAIDS
jgi:anti-sigma-K factor RskA